MRNILSRRQFLGAVGATLGFASIGTMNSLALSLETTSFGNLGVILPDSNLYPKLASELLDGMVQSLAKRYKISHLEKPSIDGLKNFAKTNDTIVTYASPSTAYHLRKGMSEESTQMIALDLGMDIQRFGENLPRLNYISLNYWQLSLALALWVKEELGERLLIVADSYTSGYDSFSVFESNFPQAKVVLYGTELLAEALAGEAFDAIAFALSDENVQSFITDYETLALGLPLLRLPYIGEHIQTSSPMYSASFAFTNTPFYTLGQRLAMVLQEQAYDEPAILIKHGQHPVAQYIGSQLPYHGINSPFKTGWTNAYPI